MTVVDGSYLLGADGPDRALLLVTGDPATVIGELGQQLTDRGWEPTGAGFREKTGSEPARFQLCVMDSCSLRFQPKGRSGPVVGLRLVRRGPPAAMSLLTITWGGRGEPAGDRFVAPWPLPAGDSAPLPTTWPKLARPGQEIPDFPLEPGAGPFRIEHGSAQVLPVYEPEGGVGIGHVLLRIDGEPADVFDGYVDQIKAKLHGEGLDVDRSEADGATVTKARGGIAGGWHYDLTMLSRPGEPAWAELVVTSDH